MGGLSVVLRGGVRPCRDQPAPGSSVVPTGAPRPFPGASVRRACQSRRGVPLAPRSRCPRCRGRRRSRSEEHTSELQSQSNLVCRLLLEKKKNKDKELMQQSKRTNIDYN